MPKRERSESPLLGPQTESRTLHAEWALLEASSSGDLNTVNALLERGVDINCRDAISGKTPLIRAVRENKIDIVKALIKHNADITIVDNDSHDALYFAIYLKMPDLVRELIIAASKLSSEEYQIFLDGPYHIQGSPLEMALNSRQIEIVRALVDAGATSSEAAPLVAANVFRFYSGEHSISSIFEVGVISPLPLLPYLKANTTVDESTQSTLIVSDSEEESFLLGDDV